MILAEAGGLGASLIELVGTGLALVLSTVAVSLYRAWAKDKKDAKVEAVIRSVINTAVSATEQWAINKWGEKADKAAEKLSYAKAVSKIRLNKAGVSIDETELELLLEEEVHLRNAAKKLISMTAVDLRD